MNPHQREAKEKLVLPTIVLLVCSPLLTISFFDVWTAIVHVFFLPLQTLGQSEAAAKIIFLTYLLKLSKDKVKE
jgi:hypothetical protein